MVTRLSPWQSSTASSMVSGQGPSVHVFRLTYPVGRSCAGTEAVVDCRADTPVLLEEGAIEVAATSLSELQPTVAIASAATVDPIAVRAWILDRPRRVGRFTSCSFVGSSVLWPGNPRAVAGGGKAASASVGCWWGCFRCWVSRYRLVPTAEQAAVLREHCRDVHSALLAFCLDVEQGVEGVALCGAPGVGGCAVDVALGGDHRFVAEKFHECVDADVGVGQFGGEGVA